MILLIMLLQCITPITAYNSNVVVHRVIDGDTFEFIEDNTPFRVRVLNLDTYESANNSRANKQAKELNIPLDSVISRGKRAKEYAKNLLENKKVHLIRIDKNQDSFGRLLRQVKINGLSYDSLMIANKLGLKYD